MSKEDSEILVFTPRPPKKRKPGEVHPSKMAQVKHMMSRATFIQKAEQFKVQIVKDIQDHLLKMAPKALAIKDFILESPKASIWLKNTVGTEVLDRLAPKPTQNISVKGALVTAQYSDEELKKILLGRILNAAQEENTSQEGEGK